MQRHSSSCVLPPVLLDPIMQLKAETVAQGPVQRSQGAAGGMPLDLQRHLAQQYGSLQQPAALTSCHAQQCSANLLTVWLIFAPVTSSVAPVHSAGAAQHPGCRACRAAAAAG